MSSLYLVAEEDAAGFVEIGAVDPGGRGEVDDLVVRQLNGEGDEQKLMDVAVLDDDGAGRTEAPGHLEVQVEAEVDGNYDVAGCDPVQDGYFLAHEHFPRLCNVIICVRSLEWFVQIQSAKIVTFKCPILRLHLGD